MTDGERDILMVLPGLSALMLPSHTVCLTGQLFRKGTRESGEDRSQHVEACT